MAHLSSAKERSRKYSENMSLQYKDKNPGFFLTKSRFSCHQPNTVILSPISQAARFFKPTFVSLGDLKKIGIPPRIFDLVFTSST